MAMEKSIKKLYHPLRDYIFILVGTMIYAFGFNAFIVSNEVVPGGLTGLCSLIFFSVKIPISVSYAIINIGLLVIAFKILGLRFVINTTFGVISLTLSLILFEWLLKGHPIVPDQPFMSIIIGGALCGTGLGIIFSGNGSTGGTDIIGAIINKYKDISIGRSLLYCDFVIIASSYFLFHSLEKIVFGYVAMFAEMYILDQVLNANNQSVQFLIFSQKYDEISDRIIKELGRGCTILDGEGGYSKRKTKVIVLLAKKRESVYIFRLIKDVDSHAFISQSNVRGVYGEGFDPIKT